MFALFYRNVTEPEIVYDIGRDRILHGPVNKISVLSAEKCLLDGVPYALQPTERWQTLRCAPLAAASHPAYNVFCCQYESATLGGLLETTTIDSLPQLAVALSHAMDVFFLLQKPEFTDSVAGKRIYNSSAGFDVAAYAVRSRFFSDSFGMFFAHGATTFAPNLVLTKAGRFISDPLSMALWTTMRNGSALFSQALGKVYYDVPQGGQIKRFSGAGLLLAPVNYGHWHTQNAPALFALKQLFDLGVLSESDVTVVAPETALANADLLEHYLSVLDISPKIFDPTKEGVVAFSFERTLLPSSCAVGAFHWSAYIARSLAILSEAGKSSELVLFVSRADVGNARGLLNEAEVLRALADAGIPVQRVVAYELSHRQQRALFGRAKLVIGTHGSGLTNALYGGPQCAVLELICDALDGNRGWYHNLFHFLGQPYAAVNAPLIDHEWSSPFRVDPALVVAAATDLLAGGRGDAG